MEPNIISTLTMLLDPWRKTSYGENPWTAGAVMAVIRHMAYYEAAIDLISGTLSSCYRSPEVNAKIPGASPTSLHMEGLACDIVPSPAYSIRHATEVIWRATVDDKLGKVREVILEPGWVHVGWHRSGGSGRKLLQKTPSGYALLRL